MKHAVREWTPIRRSVNSRQSGGIMAIAIGRNIGMLLLAIYLILVGLVGLTAIPLGGPIIAVLALLAGIFILVGR
jgi:hypothetical protein